MQIRRVFVSLTSTISNKITHFHGINSVRIFSTKEKPDHHKQIPNTTTTTVLPINLRMDIADKQAQELSEYIRATHGKLRNEYRKIKDPDAVWSIHIENKEELQHYAAAMHKLAELWEAKVEDKDYVSRLNWCYQALQTYFRKGELEKTRDKELRTVSFHLPNLLAPAVSVESPSNSASATTAHKETPATNTLSVVADSINCDVGGDHVASQSIDRAPDCGTADKSSSSRRESIVYGDRLKVLDVGSCYNPFSRYLDLDVTALDLQPATEDVYQCDFLKLKISDPGSSFLGASPIRPATEQCNETGSAEKDTAVTTSRVISTLPANSFDAVVFSYLLSYIPSPELRLRCCKNAYHLLKPEGALVIAAADSRGLIGNGYVYKCWQITMASLGFARINYEKFKDFHGMVFRKGMYPEVWQIDANRKLEGMKAKKSEMETDMGTLKESRIKFSKRRIRQVESFDLDKAFIGLWLPHDFKDSNEEEYVVRAINEGSCKRKRESATDCSEQENDDFETASKISKMACPFGKLDQEVDHLAKIP